MRIKLYIYLPVMKWGQDMPRTLAGEGRYQDGNFRGSMTVLLPRFQTQLHQFPGGQIS